MAVKHYRELQVWQKAMDLAQICYQHTKAFPKDEVFGMVSQIRRSASSVPANIAEGQGRGPGKEFLHFLRLARGSLSELETHLLLCERVGLLSASQLEELLKMSDEISRMLRGLGKSIVSMRKATNVGSELATHNTQLTTSNGVGT